MYEFKCPGCNANYVGKTDRCLYTRIKEHSSLDSSEIYNHITSCNEFNFVINILELTPNYEVNNMGLHANLLQTFEKQNIMYCAVCTTFTDLEEKKFT